MQKSKDQIPGDPGRSPGEHHRLEDAEDQVHRSHFILQTFKNNFLSEFRNKELLLAEELPAVPAVVASLGEGEPNRAAGAAVHHLVLHPVVGCRAARLVTDRPAEDPAAPVAHQDLTVVPEERMKERTVRGQWNVVEQPLTVCEFGAGHALVHRSYLEMAREEISAGWALSFRSNAVCMVSLLLKTSWRSHL